MRVADLHRRVDALARRVPPLPAQGLAFMTTGEARARLADLLGIDPEGLAGIGPQLPALLRAEFQRRFGNAHERSART